MEPKCAPTSKRIRLIPKTFFSLPPELRNKIYTYCLPPLTKRPGPNNLSSIHITYNPRGPQQNAHYISATSANPAYVDTKYSRAYELREAANCSEHVRWCRDNLNGYWTYDSRGPRITGIGILGACKQMYREAAPMVYSQYLVFADPESFLMFAQGLSGRTAGLLRHVEVGGWAYRRDKAHKRQRLRCQMALGILKEKGVRELMTLRLHGGRGGLRKDGVVLRRSGRRG
ncbi:hypothetical protein M011DRAFT_481246 [Sporormia fimetaria CBS 119925]|uniref:DUF7730 domain-containing protein n=1 Tax=Sporormia fimetaria CBS 119925 TaxID=1340428 RepID=A0A6A6UZM8_9PLEO|nr:hypothetical protein M011DRAFT_481246 [Sporormia fimetaria CBS 119925]